MKTPVLRVMRFVALLEGTSFLLLLFVAMPLKYWFEQPMPVTYVGWAHGYLFFAYVAAIVLTMLVGAIGLRRGAISFAAGFVPFGTFLNDRPLKARQAEIS